MGMKFVTDLHLHSKYSRAVSQDMTLPKMAEWARMKGIDVLATGDFCHPFWFEQLKNELEETSKGLFRLKTNDTSASLSASQRLMQKKQALDINKSALDEEVYFLLSCEISSIYSQGGKGRRIHNLFFFPSLKSVEKFNKELILRGANLRSDGRPIVGITSADLTKIALNIDKKALIIPAHAWIPWFSIFGSFSGFDSISECFGDMAPYIYGIETGLSSDPAMNWQIADLDKRAILSFSDAHSLEKMGREATVFEADELSYDAIYRAIAGPVSSFPSVPSINSGQAVRVYPERSRRAVGNPSRTAIRNLSNHPTIQPSNYPKIAFTIEFYPEEGKYHYTGHRDCRVSQSPEETAQNGAICPVCGRQLTVGVMHRVEELKTRDTKHVTRDMNGVRWGYDEKKLRPPYVSLVPLGEIIAEALGTAVKTKGVYEQYKLLVDNFGSEFAVLLKTQIDDLRKVAHPKVVEAIAKVRNGEIKIEPGYDGKFGVVKIWDEVGEEQVETKEDQLDLFA